MTRFIRILTAITVLVHASLGCCAHEVHSLDGAECGHRDQASCQHVESHQHVGVGHANCQQAHSDDHANSNQSKQPTPHDCDHAKCNWAAPELRDCDQLQMQSFTANFECLPLSSFFVQWIEVNGSTAFSNDFSPFTIPLRSHLLHCVLLI